MVVFGVNRVLNWCQIFSGGKRYTCPTKEINGQLCFVFKKIWYPVADFITENGEELVRENGLLFSRPFKK